MAWWPPDVWEHMKAGNACPMCADGHLPVNEHGDLLAVLPGSYVRLARNQTHAGYCVVIARRHAAELHDLTNVELHEFWIDVAAVGGAIQRVFSPAKLDNLVMGHLCPHVHCHVYPQYPSDDPHSLINVQHGSANLDDAAWTERVGTLARAVRDAADDRRAGPASGPPD